MYLPSRLRCLLLILLLAPIAAAVQDPAPWLDLPPGWTKAVEDGVVAVVPHDLPAGSSLLFLVQPPAESPGGTIQKDYQEAVASLGPWRPVDAPKDQQFSTGWTFRFGVGVAELDGVKYTGLVVAARRGSLRGMFYVLADSDATYNHYQAAVLNAISSLQDLTHPPAKTASAPAASPSVSFQPFRLDPAFGKGISGVYVGLERGLSASAATGGVTQTLDLSTNTIRTGPSATAPQSQTNIRDYQEFDVFFPDGTYRRRLPFRGLGGDLGWERQRAGILWGTWRREGNRVIVSRGSYVTSYAIDGENLVSERDRVWHKVPVPKNQRIEGSFARADFREPGAPRLILRADGSYEDRGGFLRMVGGPMNLVVPDGDSGSGQWSEAQAARLLGGGRGTYSCENFTLTLKDQDGRVWQVNAFVPPGEPFPNIRQMVINTYALLRD